MYKKNLLPWGVGVVIATVLGLFIVSHSSSGKSKPDPAYRSTASTTSNHSNASPKEGARRNDWLKTAGQPDRFSPKTAEGSDPGTSRRSGTLVTPDTSPQATSGLEYQTVIPRPTLKGYYEPKVIPYPTGKPVYVQGYYRRDGTYVRPHFRSLPSRRR